MFQQKQYLEPDQQYDAYIISNNWLNGWFKSKKQKQPILAEKVNSDLLHSNPYNFPSDNLVKGSQLILQNDVKPEVNYRLITNKAWKLIEQNFPTYFIRKRFYLDYNGHFIDVDKNFAVNLIICKKTLTKKLINVDFPESLSKFLQSVLKEDFHDQILGQCFLVDSRKKYSVIEQGLKDNVIFGKLITQDTNFKFSNLKAHDIIIINARDSAFQVVLQKDEIGYCYFCRKEKELIYDCSCQIVSYCSLDCKYEDFYTHGCDCDIYSQSHQDYQIYFEQYKNYDKKGYEEMGIENIGNSCYLNSILQIFKFNLPSDFQNLNQESCSDSFELAFLQQMQDLWFSKHEWVLPWFFKIHLGKLSENFLYFMQNDAHECLIAIIDSLDNGNGFGKQFAQQFVGESANVIRCKKCVNQIEKTEKFYVLSLPLSKHKPKWKIDFYSENQEGVGFVKDIMTFELSTLQDKFSSLQKQFDFPSSVLYLSSVHQVVQIITNPDETLEEIFKKKQHPEHEESCFIIKQIKENSPLNFVGISLVSNKKLQSGISVKNKIGHSKLIQFQEEEISKQDLHLKIFQYLQDLKILEQIDLPTNLTSDFLLFYYKKLFDQNFFLKKFDNETKMPQGLKYRLITKEEFETSEDYKTFTEKYGNEQAFEKYIEEYKKQLEKCYPILKKAEELKDDMKWKIIFINTEEVCQNCNKIGNHTCNLEINNKTIKLTKLINLQIDLGEGIKLTPELIDQLKLTQETVESQDKKNGFRLQNCFNGFFQKEEVEFKCEKCQHPEATLHSIINKYPKILVFHLKRFQTIYEDGEIKNKKNLSMVEIPSIFEVGQNSYSLCGVINHKGELTYGHYTCYAKNDQNEWYFFNDSQVRHAEEKEVNSPENYIVFFKLDNQSCNFDSSILLFKDGRIKLFSVSLVFPRSTLFPSSCKEILSDSDIFLISIMLLISKIGSSFISTSFFFLNS